MLWSLLYSPTPSISPPCVTSIHPALTTPSQMLSLPLCPPSSSIHPSSPKWLPWLSLKTPYPWRTSPAQLYLNRFKANRPGSSILKGMLDYTLFEGICTILEEILEEGWYIIFWLKRPNCIQNHILLVYLLWPEIANVQGLDKMGLSQGARRCSTEKAIRIITRRRIQRGKSI